MSEKSSLFFDPSFKFETLWGGKHAIRIGSVTPVNKKQILSGLKDMSSESIRNRFLGSKKEFSEAELEYLTNLDGWNHYAIGVEELQGPKRGIAIVRLVRSQKDSKEAEIAITIIDEYQKMGFGSLLIQLISLASLERGIERLSFTFLPQNQGIIKLVHKMGIPKLGVSQMDYVQLYVEKKDIKVQQMVSEIKGFYPPIEDYLQV